jgi:hypothetical protein
LKYYLLDITGVFGFNDGIKQLSFYPQGAIILFLIATEGTVESMYKCLKNIYGDGTGDRSTEGCWGKFVR